MPYQTDTVPVNHPGQLRAALGLLLALDGLNDLLDGPPPAEGNRAGRSAPGLHYMVRLALSAIDAELIPTEGPLADLRELILDGGVCLPEADDLAQAVLDLLDDDGSDTEEDPCDPDDVHLLCGVS
jgi:hypothetical protein